MKMPQDTGQSRSRPDVESPPGERAGFGIAWAFAAAAAVTLLASPLANRLDLANIVMPYLLAVVLIAFRYGKGPAVVAAIVNVAAFDYFFVPPRFSFTVADSQYLLTFVVMLVTGLVIAHLADELKQQLGAANLRDRRSRDLYEMARVLSAALGDEQIVEAVREFFARSFNASVLLLVRDRAGKLARPDAAAYGLMPDMDMAVAQCVLDAEGAADVTTVGRVVYVPLKAPVRTRGVLLVAPAVRTIFEDPVQRQQLETVAVLIAIALERIHFVTVAREATVQMEGERMRSGLLAALSHDLRTPLTAILGSAESLKLGAPDLTAERIAMIDAIGDQARHTNALVENILDMARLESGIHLRREWQPLEEIVGSALKACGPSLSKHQVDVSLPPDLPLVDCDATLVERVLVNVLENAAKYSPAGGTIRIAARVEGDALRVDVADSGGGVPRGQEAAIFNKFFRAHPSADVPGLGLGLAICKTIVEAHGGRIWVENVPAGGADFAFALPLGNPPAVNLEASEQA